MSKDRTLEESCLMQNAMLKGEHHKPQNVMEAHVFQWHKDLRVLFGMAQMNKGMYKANKEFVMSLKVLRASIDIFLTKHGDEV